MAFEFLMPKMGMTMEEGTIISWRKKIGEHVDIGDVILDIQTDKVRMEVESPAAGILLKILAAEGAVVPVNIPIAYIGEAGEEIADVNTVAEVKQEAVASVSKAVNEEAPQLTKVRATPAAKRLAKEKGLDLQNIKPSSADGVITAGDVESQKVTPLARRIASDKGIDLSSVAGSGDRGKILSSDLKQLEEQSLDSGTKAAVSPLVGLRKVIAERMSLSWQNAPHASISLDVDMSEMTVFRKQVMQDIKDKTGVKVSFNHLLIKVVARALKENPVLNARFIDQGVQFVNEVNVGVAVASEGGLIVPVLHEADQLSVVQIVAKTEELIQKARNSSLVLRDLEGGTFTISNLGMYGITTFSPILNPPEVGILGAGVIAERAVVEEGALVVRPYMTLSLSFDHRAVDGAQAAVFLARVKELLTTPLKLL
jgi:pyruvate dehydrogenase E2 component (dihydrolipoamide acetyltransferase)